MKLKNLEEFEIWKLSVEMSVEIYQITNQPNFIKDFGLRDQIRRAIVSVSSNIAEGYERNNNKEFKRYLKISKGSVGEVKTQLYIAFRINYLNHEVYERLSANLLVLSLKIGSLISYLEKISY